MLCNKTKWGTFWLNNACDVLSILMSLCYIVFQPRNNYLDLGTLVLTPVNSVTFILVMLGCEIVAYLPEIGYIGIQAVFLGNLVIPDVIP